MMLMLVNPLANSSQCNVISAVLLILIQLIEGRKCPSFEAPALPVAMILTTLSYKCYVASSRLHVSIPIIIM